VPLTSTDLAVRYTEPYFYSPSDAQLQDYQIAVEGRMAEALEANLPL
jgi:hypothetical protein